MSENQIIEVVQAHKEGKQIQTRDHFGHSGWQNCHPVWDFYHNDYRVKPEPRKPREWWIHLNASGMHEVHETTENRSHCGHCILVREVMDDSEEIKEAFRKAVDRL